MQGIDRDTLAFLLTPEGSKSFWQDVWEKTHKVYKATRERKEAFEGLLSFPDLCSLLKQQEEKGKCLQFVKDIHAMRYVDGEREDVMTEPFSPIESGEAEELYEAGATFQVHQPQRFNDKLWRICAALEAQIGCLVGCNAYVTPPDAQGLAPHYDDVDLWVCQTSGKKRWTVYGALPGQELPPASSSDIPRGALPPPLLEVTLQPGDVLYLPRGHVHEAQALGPGSSHVTISSYQQWSWKDLLDRVIGSLAMSAGGGPQLPRSLRAGVPAGFVYRLGLSKEVMQPLAEAVVKPDSPGDPTVASSLGSSAAAAEAAAALARGLRDAAAAVEAAPDVVAVEAQAMGAKFMRARLPPHPASLPDGGPAPTLRSRICCRKADAFMLVADEAVESSESESDGEMGYNMLGEDMLGSGSSDGGSDGSDSAGSASDAEDSSDGDVGAGEKKARPAKGRRGATDTTAGGKSAGAVAEAPSDDADEDDDLDSADGDSDGDSGGAIESFCRLLTCLHNDRETHMVSGGGTAEGPDPLVLMGTGGGVASSDDKDGDEAPALVPLESGKGGAGAAGGDADDGGGGDAQMPWFLDMPLGQALAVTRILDCVKGKTVEVADLPLGSDDEKLELTMALHSWGMLRTVPDAPKKRALEHGGKAGGAGKKKKANHKKK